MTTRKLYHLLFICALLAIPLTVYGQIHNTQVAGEIAITNNGEFIAMTGTAANLQEANKNLRYVLSIITVSPEDGTTQKEDLKGLFTLRPLEKKEIISSSTPIDKEHQIIILLLIYDEENKLLGKDRKVIDFKKDQGIEDTTDAVTAEQQFVGIRGLVTEDTKTKAGRDFFTIFSTDYRMAGINGVKPINIKEVISLGRNTNIEVWIENTLIYRFFSRPKEDFLRGASAATLYRVNRYFTNLNKTNNALIQY